MTARVRIGISSCLLGERVRYDGGHKRDAYVMRTLARNVELVPVCPEVGIGMGVPRPPIHLVGRAGATRALGRDDPTLDVTAALGAYGRRMARDLDNLSGYLFKSRSPSCGIQQVPVYGGARVRAGRGIYADAFLAVHPQLPAIEESDLTDPERRDNFLERVFAYRRWQVFAAAPITPARLRQFHALHQLALVAHDPRAARALADLLQHPRVPASEYFAGFMQTLSRPATPARHQQALLYALNHFPHELDRRQHAALRAAIASMRRGELTRAAVLTLLRRLLRRHPHAELVRQVYLFPDPLERRLRRL